MRTGDTRHPLFALVAVAKQGVIAGIAGPEFFGGASGGTNVLAFFLIFAALGCGLFGAWNLFTHPKRWIHRFVIYTGYATTASFMGAAILYFPCTQRPETAWRCWGLLIGICALGSAGIFTAKTLTVRYSRKKFPAYDAG